MSQPGSTPVPVERALVVAVPILGVGLVAAPFLLLVPSDWSVLARFLVQLSVLTVGSLVLAARLAPLLADPWFVGADWSARAKRAAAASVLVVIATGVVGLVTLATSAALRFEPSLQFLQLLSALDIAWVVAGTTVGAMRLWGERTGITAGAGIGVVCVLSIWNYLRVVGFTTAGGWRLDGSELLRLVIPGDVVAAVVAVTVLGVAVRRDG